MTELKTATKTRRPRAVTTAAVVESLTSIRTMREVATAMASDDAEAAAIFVGMLQEAIKRAGADA